jgi:CRISPR-associated protein Cas5t
METERVPPPSTVYGFLLSLVGEEDRRKYVGTNIAIAVTREPEVSRVLRTAWRFKSSKSLPGTGSNKRPDYKEILTGLEFCTWISMGELSDRLIALKNNPGSINRFGGLSLGESSELVDEVSFFPELTGATGKWLVIDDEGEFPFPVWVDHVGSRGTRWVQVKMISDSLLEPGPSEKKWIPILPPE